MTSKSNLEAVLSLEWLGIHIEKMQEAELTSLAPAVVYFSVPESSLIEIDGKKTNEKIKTSDQEPTPMR